MLFRNEAWKVLKTQLFICLDAVIKYPDAKSFKWMK